MNIAWSQRIFEELHREGVRDVVFCAGARNSPLVSVLAKSSGFELHSFFEERSAAFYALGLSRRTGRPSVVITTSGTAVAELLPAAIEAFHTGVPLILVTADRPKRLRGSGAPQAIDQAGMFTKFVGLESDLETGEMFSLQRWNRRSPVHINVCFDEPLLDKTILEFDLGSVPSSEESELTFAGRSSFPVSSGSEWAMLRLTKFLRTEDPLVVIVGTLETHDEREETASFLRRLGAPAYLEGTSGLRERSDLQEISIKSGDRLLNWALKMGLIGRVLRIGGIPTVRIWRDLDEKDSPVEVLSLTSLPFSGLSRGEFICTEIAPVLRSWSGAGVCHRETHFAKAISDKDQEVSNELERLYEAEPLAEPSLVRELSKLVPSKSLVYIGNSLPIREWDLAASRESVFPVEANRGVNGIDGQISTFLGLARGDEENWAVFGDLTTLYDLAAPWALLSRPGLTVRIVVLNNGGGKIFQRIFRTSLFENRHDLDFEHWARMWRLSYQKWTSVPKTYSGAAVEVIELVPDEEATKSFWDHYDKLWL